MGRRRTHGYNPVLARKTRQASIDSLLPLYLPDGRCAGFSRVPLVQGGSARFEVYAATKAMQAVLDDVSGSHWQGCEVRETDGRLAIHLVGAQEQTPL